ncbi:TVP38/TMEM64 family protein [Streptomyces achromogenes]|uniref:TVP38/TMEM64 family protein n=1 Tax=Streptomyces achromogenes TaxID=67255 RepID=UPI003A80997F
MLDANRSGTAPTSPPAATPAPPASPPTATPAAPASPPVVMPALLAITPGPALAPAGAGAVPVLPRAGFAARCTRLLLSPYARLSLLVALLAGGAAGVLVCEPQRLLTHGWPPQLGGAAAALVFAAAYGLCTVVFVPRPLLNLAAGAMFGSQVGLATALAGTVLGAGVAFGLGRALGQDALRPLLRGRWLKAADGQLSRHGLRSMLALRLFPGVPFWAANYCASVSRMGWLPFLLATALGSIPNTAAYAVAGARASTPTSPAFLIAMGCIAVPALAGTVLAWRKRHRLRAG